MEANLFSGFSYANGASGGLKRSSSSSDLILRHDLCKKRRIVNANLHSMYVEGMMPIGDYLRARFLELEKKGLGRAVLLDQKDERESPASESALFGKIKKHIDANPLGFFGQYSKARNGYSDPAKIEKDRDEGFAMMVKMKNDGRHVNRIVFVNNGKFFNAFGVDGLIASNSLNYKFRFTHCSMGLHIDTIQNAINILLREGYEMVICQKMVTEKNRKNI